MVITAVNHCIRWESLAAFVLSPWLVYLAQQPAWPVPRGPACPASLAPENVRDVIREALAPLEEKLASGGAGAPVPVPEPDVEFVSEAERDLVVCPVCPPCDREEQPTVGWSVPSWAYSVLAGSVAPSVSYLYRRLRHGAAESEISAERAPPRLGSPGRRGGGVLQ